MAEKLLTDPPSAAVDPILGNPRNRTELVENLIKYAYRLWEKERAKKSGS